MCIDNQRAVPRRATHKIVSSIADDQSNIVVSRKVDSSLDMVLGLRHDDVFGIVPTRAAGRGVGDQRAGVVRPVRPEVGDGLFRAVKQD